MNKQLVQQPLLQDYRVRAGMTFGKGKEHQPGDVVQLTEQEAEGFLDKLELVDAVAPAMAQRLDAGFTGPIYQTTEPILVPMTSQAEPAPMPKVVTPASLHSKKG